MAVCDAHGIDASRTAAGLAVDGYGLRSQGGQNAAHPAPESGLEPVQINQPEDASDGVVRSNSMRQFEIGARPLQPFLGPQLDLGERVGAL